MCSVIIDRNPENFYNLNNDDKVKDGEGICCIQAREMSMKK